MAILGIKIHFCGIQTNFFEFCDKFATRLVYNTCYYKNLKFLEIFGLDLQVCLKKWLFSVLNFTFFVFKPVFLNSLINLVSEKGIMVHSAST